MRLHIEGMGLQGAMLLHLLKERGTRHVEITWDDQEVPTSAWQASTGAIYPAGSTKFGHDLDCYHQWRGWHLEGLFYPHIESAHYWFNHKSPPHEGRYKIDQASPAGLNRASVEFPSLHLNAQTFVQDMRARYRAYRVSRVPEGRLTRVVAHSNGTPRLSHYYWGWTRLVELEYDTRVFGGDFAQRTRRPCFYFREGRFIMAYAYPVPGTRWWYAGSSIIRQATPKKLEMEGKYARWKANFERLGQGEVRVTREGAFMEGWRPAAGVWDHEWAVRAPVVGWLDPHTILLRPCWNNGIRHFPQQLESLLNLVPELI